jgi:hypothetical protein
MLISPLPWLTIYSALYGPTACEAVKKFPGRAKAFRAETQSRRGTKKTMPLIFPSLCASASLREIVYFFTASCAVGHTSRPSADGLSDEADAVRLT